MGRPYLPHRRIVEAIVPTAQIRLTITLFLSSQVLTLLNIPIKGPPASASDGDCLGQTPGLDKWPGSSQFRPCSIVGDPRAIKWRERHFASGPPCPQLLVAD
jgi:hypothetical protein